jgi:hypothetical protein
MLLLVACLLTGVMHSVLCGSSVAVSSTPPPTAKAVTNIDLITIPVTPILVAGDSCGNALDTYEAVASWTAVGGICQHLRSSFISLY